MTIGASPRLFQISYVITRVTGVLGRNAVVFGLLALVLAAAPSALLVAVQFLLVRPVLTASPSEVFANAFSPLNIGLAILGAVVVVVGRTVLQGALMHGTIKDSLGERVSFGDCLATGVRYLLPLIGIGIVSAICEAFGFLLLLIPGIILSMAWCVAAPSAVVERRGVFASLTRSADLTRDNRLSIFWLALILVVIQFIVSWVTGALSSSAIAIGQNGAPTQTFRLVLQVVVSLLNQTVLATLQASGAAAIYFELREAREGIGAEQLASTFD